MMIMIAQVVVVLLVAVSVDTMDINRVDRRISNRELDLKSQIEALRDNFLAERRLQKEIGEQMQEDIQKLKIAVQMFSSKMESLKEESIKNHTDQDGRLSALQFKIADPQLPELRFTEVYGGSPGRVVMEQTGTALRDGPDRAYLTTVRTDGALTAGRHYWELAVTWSVEDPDLSGSDWWSVAAVGVRQNGSDFGDWLGRDDQSWAVWVRYNPGLNQWRYLCRHGGKAIFTSTRVTHDRRSDVTNRLGFLLDTEKHTLAVVDINNSNRLFSFRALGGSKPLVPAVTFGIPAFQRRFRLRTIEPSRLPKTVTNLLQSS